MDHSQSRIKFKTAKQFNELVEQSRTSTKSLGQGNYNTKNNHSSLQASKDSFPHNFLSETKNQIPAKQPSLNDNQQKIKLQKDICTSIQSLRNEGRLYSSSNRERKYSNFLEEESSIPHKDKNSFKESIIRRSSCDCGKCGGKCHKLQNLKGQIPQFLPRQVIRNSVKQKLNNVQKTLRRLSIFFRLTNSQSHSHTPSAALNRKSALGLKCPQLQERETKMIYPHKDKIDLKGNIFPLNEEEIEGGKFHHKKDSISNIALYNSRNSRLFKVNSNTDIDYVETPQNSRKSVINNSPSSKCSGNNSNKNCTEQLRNSDTFNQLDQMLSRVDGGFFEELAHQAQDKLDKEQINIEEHKKHKQCWIDHSQKLESKGIYKSYAKYLTPPHPTLLSILNKPRVSLPHSSSISILSCRSDRQSSFQGFKPSILDLKQLKPINYEDSSLLSSERQQSVSKYTMKTAVSLTLIPSSPKSNSSKNNQQSAKYNITLLDKSTAQACQNQKQKMSFNQKISSFSQLQVSKYRESTIKPTNKKTLPYLENQYCVLIQQQSSDGTLKQTSKKAQTLSSSSSSYQLIKNDEESTNSTSNIFLNKKCLSKQLIFKNFTINDPNKARRQRNIKSQSIVLSNTHTDFQVRRGTYALKSEYFTKNEISTQSQSKLQYSPQQKQYEQLNNKDISASLITPLNSYKSKRLSHLFSTKNQQSSINKKGKQNGIEDLKEVEELSQSENKGKQDNNNNNNTKKQKIVFRGSKDNINSNNYSENLR